MANIIGSVFLGDLRARRISSSTPPSSPPPTLSPSAIGDVGASSADTLPKLGTPVPPLPEIDPELSLELRLRWIEAILFGVQDAKGKQKVAGDLKLGTSLNRSVEDVQRRLNAVVESNEGLKRFMSTYDQHAALLTPSFALSGVVSSATPAYENLSGRELEALLAEMEPDIRAADRDVREIEMLEKKGVIGAGNLADYEALQPRVNALIAAHEEDLRLASSLETRIASLVDRHAIHVDALSELFVSWDDIIIEAEDRTIRFEREKAERQRLGYD